MMRSWKSLLLLGGILLQSASVVVYIWMPGINGIPVFLALFIPGVVLLSTYFMMEKPEGNSRRRRTLEVFLLVLMFDSILITLYGLYGDVVIRNTTKPADWAMLVVAGLGYLTYVSTLALWHWKRWGLALFQGAAIALALFILMGGGSIILAGVIVVGVILLSLSLRSVRGQMN